MYFQFLKSLGVEHYHVSGKKSTFKDELLRIIIASVFTFNNENG